MVELTYLSLKKTTFFVRIFDISHCVFTQISIGRAHWMWNLILHPTSTYTTYFLWTPLPQKQEIHEKNMMMMWVLVGCGIKFRIQRALPIEIWVKTQWDMLKLRTKCSFFNDKYVNSTIMVELFYLNSIGSWIPTHKNLFWHVFL